MPPGTVFRAGSPLYPMNPYAATKAAAEMLCCSYAATYSLPVAITRCTNVIGERQHREKFLPLLIERVKSGQPVPIHTVDGQPCSRYYNYHRNVSTAVMAVLAKGDTLDRNARGGRYNISGDREVSNVELAERVGKLVGKEPKLEMVENPPGRIRPDLRYCVDSAELLELGWRPEVSFEQGLELTVRSFLGG
jgi:dTDP-glucose 4,6-dehydratase